MAEVNIPAGPIDEAPWAAIRCKHPERQFEVAAWALESALDGVELGDYDREILSWLAGWELATVAAVCSWLHRVRAAAATDAGGAVSHG